MSSQTKIIKDILSLYDTILENKEVEETTASLRDTIKNLGYSEKGSELTSGGNVNDKITEIVSEILSQYKKTNPSVTVKITAGNDTYHQNLDYTSQHKLGNAIDVTIDPYNNKNASSFITILKEFKTKYSDFSYIDEYTNPSSSSTGGHFHLQYGKDSSSNATSGNETEGGTEGGTEGETEPNRPHLDALVKGVTDIVFPMLGIKEETKVKDNWFKKKRLNENIDRIKGLL